MRLALLEFLIIFLANPRSRAAKRATSPSIDLDKSLRDAPRRSDTNLILGVSARSGVTKPKRKQKPMTKGQRRRQVKGLERAEVVQDQLKKKVIGSQSREKKRNSRRAIWEEINSAVGKDAGKSIVTSVEINERPDEDEWEDEDVAQNGDDTEMKVLDGVHVPADVAGTKLVVVDRTTASLEPIDDADRIT